MNFRTDLALERHERVKNNNPEGVDFDVREKCGIRISNIKVLDENREEVELMESIDYGDTDLRSVIEGESRRQNREDFAEHGYTQQEFDGEELVNVEDDVDDEIDDAFFDFDEMSDED